MLLSQKSATGRQATRATATRRAAFVVAELMNPIPTWYFGLYCSGKSRMRREAVSHLRTNLDDVSS